MQRVGDRVAKDALYDGFAEVAKALASGRRAEIVDVLAQGERSVDDVADEIGQTRRQHLSSPPGHGPRRGADHPSGRHADLLRAGQRPGG